MSHSVSRLKSLVAIVALTAVAVVLVGAGTGDASAGSSGDRATSKVTILPWPKLYGEVKSPKPWRCARQRRVAIFSQEGKQRRPGSDRRVARTVTRRYRGVYQWQAKTGPGSFYAKAHRTPGCKVSLSRTVKTTVRGAGQECPATEGLPGCRLSEVHFDTLSCANYLTRSVGDCDGSTAAAGADFDTCPKYANFHWNPAGRRRGVALYVDQCGEFPRVHSSHLEGWVDEDALGRFNVGEAWAKSNPDVKFCTPDPPIEGVLAGEEGGPLRIRFVNGITGADIYISGVLVRRGSRYC